MTMTETTIPARALRPADTLADGTVIDTAPFITRGGVVEAEVVTPAGDRATERWPVEQRLTVTRRYSGEVW